jgi:hypothetical protein
MWRSTAGTSSGASALPGTLRDLSSSPAHAPHRVANGTEEPDAGVRDATLVTAEDANAVLEEPAVGGIPDRSFDHGRVDPHPAPRSDATLDRDRHDAIEERAQLGAVDRLLEPHERRRVRHTLGADPAEVAIADVAAHLTLGGLEGPVAEPAQHQHPQHHLSGSPVAPSRRAVWTPLAKRSEHGFDERLVIEQMIEAAKERIDEAVEIGHYAEEHDLGEQELPMADANGHCWPGTSSGEIGPCLLHPTRSNQVLGEAVATTGSSSA